MNHKIQAHPHLLNSFEASGLTGLNTGLPDIQRIEDFTLYGASAWAKAHRINAELVNGTHESYFMKVRSNAIWSGAANIVKLSVGDHGREALKGEFEGTAAIYSVTPEFVPKPIAWGAYESTRDTYFYICKFHELDLELPDPEDFCSTLATLHQDSASPNGRYGFHVTTYNGDVPQKNDWEDSWEVFFSRGLKHIFELNFQRGGPCKEFDELMPDLFGKVIPRLLRPLETNGNSIKPSLVHGDLWCGNAAIDIEADQPIVFDPSGFWAHNECRELDSRLSELGTDLYR